MATKFDKRLYRAVINADIAEIKSLIEEQGANPLAVVTLDHGSKSHAYTRMFFERNVTVIYTIIDIALQRYKKTGENILDFSGLACNGLKADGSDAYRINLLQYVCLFYPEHGESLIRYALDTKQDVAALLNATILVPDGHGEAHRTTLMQLLIQHIAVGMLDVGSFPTKKNQGPAYGTFVRAWLKTDGSKPLPPYELPLEILYTTPWENLEYYIDKGLELDCGLFTKVIASSKTTEAFEDFKKKLLFDGVTPTSVARYDELERVCFDAELENERGCKLSAVIVLNYNALEAMVQRKMKARDAHKGLVDLSTKVETLSNTQGEMKQQITNTASDVEEIPSVRLSRFKKRPDVSDEIKECVDVLFDKIASYFEAQKARTTGLFVNNRTTDEARCALLLSGAFSRIADASGVPFVPLFAGFVGGGVDYITSQYAKKQSAGVGKAIMKQDIDTLSLDIALAIAAAVQAVYGNRPNVGDAEKIALAVTKEIDNLHKHPDVRGQSAVFQHLLAVALNTVLKLNPDLTLSKNSSGSSKSSPVIVFSSAGSQSSSSASSNGNSPGGKFYPKQTANVPNLSSSKGLEKMVALKDEAIKLTTSKERKKGFRCVIS